MRNVLIITGASRGIGAATAALFAARGYSVYNLSRSHNGAAGVIHIPVDLTAPDWVAQHGATLHQICTDASRVVLIHNAGAIIKDAVTTFDVDEFRRVMAINVTAPAQLTALLLPHMPRSSAIIYVGSTLSEQAVSNSCAYVTSKHAVVGLMRSTCQDLAGRGIHTVCVCPGFTDTEMLRDHVGNSAEVLALIAGGVTFGRLISPDEIAETLWFSSQSPVLNGAVLHANLGQVQH